MGELEKTGASFYPPMLNGTSFDSKYYVSQKLGSFESITVEKRLGRGTYGIAVLCTLGAGAGKQQPQQQVVLKLPVSLVDLEEDPKGSGHFKIKEKIPTSDKGAVKSNKRNFQSEFMIVERIFDSHFLLEYRKQQYNRKTKQEPRTGKPFTNIPPSLLYVATLESIFMRRHPGFESLHQVYEYHQGERFYIMSEPCTMNLQEFIKRDPSAFALVNNIEFSPTWQRLLVSMYFAIRYLHEVAGVIHSDIKEVNIFVKVKNDKSVLFLLGDFGGFSKRTAESRIKHYQNKVYGRNNDKNTGKPIEPPIFYHVYPYFMKDPAVRVIQKDETVQVYPTFGVDKNDKDKVFEYWTNMDYFGLAQVMARCLPLIQDKTTTNGAVLTLRGSHDAWTFENVKRVFGAHNSALNSKGGALSGIISHYRNRKNEDYSFLFDECLLYKGYTGFQQIKKFFNKMMESIENAGKLMCDDAAGELKKIRKTEMHVSQ